MTAFVRPEEGALFDLSARTKLRVTGADRVRYLNGQISNDLRKANETRAIRACVLNAKGKINADLYFAPQGEAFMLDADAEVRETLIARLERYIIADDVQIEDVTEQFALFHFLEGGKDIQLEGRQVRWLESERFGNRGRDLWIKAEECDAVWEELAGKWPVCDETCAERLRIERGLPRWGRELTEEIIPVEANLEAGTIDYEKGCYIGQEVISRMKMSGQTNKRLCGVLSLNEAPLRAGMRLTTGEGKEVGWITSATRSALLGKEIGLAYVKRGFGAPGTELATEPPGARVCVVALPFRGQGD